MSDYIASSPEELQAMLDSLGLKDLDALTGHLPEAVLLNFLYFRSQHLIL